MEVDILLTITASISLVPCLITTFTYSRKREPEIHIQFILYMMISNCVSMIAFLINLWSCSFDMGPVAQILTQYFYLTFNQAALGWVAMVSFAQFFILTQVSNEFLDRLRKASRSLMLATFGFPLVVGLGLLLSQLGQQHHCIIIIGHGTFYTLSLIVPTSILLIVIALYDHYQMRWIRHYSTMIFTELFTRSLILELYLVPSITGGLFGLVMVCEVVYQISESETIRATYKGLMVLLNLFGAMTVYFFGVNPTLSQLVKWKVSLLNEIHSIKLGVERTTGTATESRTNTKVVANGRWSNFIRFTRSNDYKSNEYESFSTNR